MEGENSINIALKNLMKIRGCYIVFVSIGNGKEVLLKLFVVMLQ